MSDIRYWKCKNGIEIRIEDMSDFHINNCIKALENGKVQCYRLYDYGYTADGEGDGKIIYEEDISNEYIEVFKNELKRRDR